MASATVSERSLRKDYELDLIGRIENQIVGAKLPSNRQVLSVLFFNLRIVKLTKKNSATLVIKEVLVFWEKARIPTKRIDHCVEKLLKLYSEWRRLHKNSRRSSERELEKRRLFLDILDDLFDIALDDALLTPKTILQEDRYFLLMQRKKGRPGYMAGIDKTFMAIEERKQSRLEKTFERKKRAYEEIEHPAGPSSLTDSSSSSQDELSELSDVEETQQKCVPMLPTKKRGTLDFFTPRLSEALDRCKISDRNAVHLLMAAAEAFNCNIGDLIINRTSFQRRRKAMREQRHSHIRGNFRLAGSDFLVLHWDGKLLPSVSGLEKVDRLAVIVTADGKEQLLGIPSIPSSEGKHQASAIHVKIEEWGLENKIQALCFDTTASNTGPIQGACAHLEKIFERNLLYLPCRHHIFELVLRSCFETFFVATSGPVIALFKRFRETWKDIDKTNYHTGTEIIPQEVRHSMLQFLCDMLDRDDQPRDDYRELLELGMIFLGSSPKRGISFRIPGALTHARWMAKAIYCFKIFLFQNQFHLTKKERSSIERICCFLIHIYIQAWFRCTSAVRSPFHDYNFMQKLFKYREIDADVSNAASRKFSNHLWYLSPETAALAFFDDTVPVQLKREMAARMTYLQDSDEEDLQLKRYFVQKENVRAMLSVPFSHFITRESIRFFERFKINVDFLKECPTTWKNNTNYQDGFKKVEHLAVVNDVAERGVKLIEEYQNILTKNEEERQWIIHNVSEHRKKYPVATKSGLMA